MTTPRPRSVALVLAGLVLGSVLWASPASSHVAGWAHNWTKHIRPKADVRYYTKAQANARYLGKPAIVEARRVAGQLGDGVILDVQGHRIEQICGGNGGSIQYRNSTGQTVRLMGPDTAGEVAAGAVRNFGGLTLTTPLVQIAQVAWGPGLERMTTFTISWTAAGGVCEAFVQAVTSG